jgi:hypothetical protein
MSSPPVTNKPMVMKCIPIALSLIFCGVAAGHQDRPKQIRVSVQFIEVSHDNLTYLLASDDNCEQALHEKALSLSKAGQAKLLETCMVVCRSGERACIESIREEIFPIEYRLPEFLNYIPSDANRLSIQAPRNPLFREITAFDTRNTGVTFEVEADVNTNGTIDLRLSPEIVTRMRLITHMEHVDQWGDGSYRMPVYETWRGNFPISVESGKFELVSTFSRKTNAPVPAVSRKILVFVRADILPEP